MKKPVAYKAGVAIDFPHKFYVGTFGRSSSLDVSADTHGLHIKLERDEAEKRRFEFHLQYYWLAELLASMAEALSDYESMDEDHKTAVREAARTLSKAVDAE